MIDDLHIIDGHVHTYVRDRLDQLIADIRYTGAKQFCCLVTARDTTGQWENALALKRRMPKDVFLLGGFDFQSGEPYEEQLQHLIDLGCDGLKLLTGKPDRRKALGVALDPICRLEQFKANVLGILWRESSLCKPLPNVSVNMSQEIT